MSALRGRVLGGFGTLFTPLSVTGGTRAPAPLKGAKPRLIRLERASAIDLLQQRPAVRLDALPLAGRPALASGRTRAALLVLEQRLWSRGQVAAGQTVAAALGGVEPFAEMAYRASPTRARARARGRMAVDEPEEEWLLLGSLIADV